MFDVITMGSATMDTFADTRNALFGKDKIPFGTKILIDTMHTHTGGGGTNTAVAFARLGLRTAWLGILGKDAFGEEILRELRHEKVNPLFIQRGEKTGQSIILDSTGHDRIILAYKGCNDDLIIDPKALSQLNTTWIYASSLMGKSFDAFLRILTHASHKGINVAFNPSAYQIRRNKRKIQSIVPQLDALVFNLEEANLLFGERKPTEHLHNIYKMGVRRIAITDGKRGAYILCDDIAIHCEAPRVRVVETTGAGDAFASGFISALIKGTDVKTAAAVGTANSGSVISHFGAKHKLLKWHEALNHRVKTRALR